MSLPEGTTESELRHLVAALHIRHRFLGVFDNSFPGFLDPEKPASAIVNTGSRRSGGMHWIGFAYCPAQKVCYMFDPFGWSDPLLWRLYRFKYQTFLRRTGLQQPDRCITLRKSNQAVQCPCSAACGLFAVLFIASFDKYPTSPLLHNPIIDTVVGVNHQDLYKPPYQQILHRNQERLYYWLSAHNSYFRQHAEHLKAATALNALPGNHAKSSIQ